MAGHRHERTLQESALDCEDAAAGLYRFRDALPRNATRITAIVSELIGLSGALRQIHNSEDTPIYGPSFYRINDDLGLLRRSLRYTTQDVFDMFARLRHHTEQSAWEDLEYQMDHKEGVGLLERLEWYRDFLEAQNDVLEGESPQDLGSIRRNVTRVLAAQQRSRLSRSSNPMAATSGSNTPRPRRSSRPARPRPPATPSITSDDLEWERPLNLHAPDPPLPMSPTSPLVSPIFSSFSSGSAQSNSSHTSYSSNSYFPSQTAAITHWAQEVFDGSYPTTRYKPEYQSPDRSKCYGESDIEALDAIASTGFQQAMQMSFDEDRLWVRLYYNPENFHALILIMAMDGYGRPLRYVERLTKLKVIREGTLLKLCRVRHGSERHTMWARLNFLLHERMVLFYNTFVGMKRQDQGGISHRILLEDLPLEKCEGGEKMMFAGEIRHGEMRHALQILRDSASRVVRIEASPLRGPRKGVAIWTAFVTRYAYDPDWAAYEGHGIVSLAKLNPEPSVFISGYLPPVNARADPVLPFATDDDARMFMDAWANLCRRYGH